MIFIKASQFLTQVLVLPFLVVASIPLLSISIITVTSAVLILSLRVLLVYVDLFFAFFQRRLSSASLETPRYDRQTGHEGIRNLRKQPVSPGSATFRRSKPNATLSTTPTTPLSSTATVSPQTRIPLANSNGGTAATRRFPTAQDRDFEGLGGWRIPDSGAGDEDANDGTWTSFNKRLELPSPVYNTAVAPPLPAHRRTPTTGAMPTPRRSPSHLTLSALTRSRSGAALSGADAPLITAPAYLSSDGGGEGYFSFQPAVDTLHSSQQHPNQTRKRSASSASGTI